MQPVTSVLQQLLLSSQRKVTAEVMIQFPNPSNNLLAAGQILLDGVINLSITRSEESVSDTIDFSVSNGDARYTPTTFTNDFGSLLP